MKVPPENGKGRVFTSPRSQTDLTDLTDATLRNAVTEHKYELRRKSFAASLARRFNKPVAIADVMPRVLAITLAQGTSRMLGGRS